MDIKGNKKTTSGLQYSHNPPSSYQRLEEDYLSKRPSDI